MQNARPEIVIEYLCDHIELAETAASWIFHEFIEGIKTDYTYEAIVARTRDCRRDALPIRFVALVGGACAGTIALVANDLRSKPYTPWLAGLYVDPAYRKLGVGQALIAKVKETAKNLGYGELYLRTEHASGYYRKLGWDYVETCGDDYGLKPEVFKTKL